MSNNPEKAARSSGADYPVDQAERSKQEARLRKAAAAGASASKSPIPALVVQLPPSEKVPESQTTLSKPTVAPETTTGRSVAGTSNEELLAELRKISAWADLQ